MSTKMPLSTKDLNQNPIKLKKLDLTSKLQKPSSLRPMSAMPLKRKLPSVEDEVPKPKAVRLENSKSHSIKVPVKTIRNPPNVNANSHSSISINKSQKQAQPRPTTAVVKKWEPRNVVELRKKATGTAAQLQSVQEKLRKTEEELEEKTKKFQKTRLDMDCRLMEAERQKDGLQGELSVTRSEVTTLKTSLDVCTSLKQQLELQVTTNQALIKQHETQLAEQQQQIQSFKTEVASLKASLEEARVKSLEDEATRKKLHNTIQELKGNIRVYSRVRPLLGEEMVGKESEVPCHMTFPDPNNKVIEVEKLPSPSPNESVAKRTGTSKHEFQFDRVFSPSASQQLVFEEISQLVQSALDGYNVCIFAYGQTGSGKTYTMEGRGVGTDRGVIQRSVEQVFESVALFDKKGWTYQVEVSFLEIYNESIRDLLASGSKEADSSKHDIRLVGPNTTEVYVTDLTTHVVTCQDQVQNLLKQASLARSVAETKCNERSSRSHSVFRMRLSGRNEGTSETCCGLLNLVDLAGSERLKDSGSQGLRLRETQNINKSLANLSNVIMALANKDAHVPYRNSKLTHLLQNCLGGSAKVLMFVNVSPKEECLAETLNSLRFATKVNQCNVGVAQKKCK